MTVIKNVDSDKQSKVDSIILEKRGKITFFIITILSNSLLKWKNLVRNIVRIAPMMLIFFSKKSAELYMAEFSL